MRLRPAKAVGGDGRAEVVAAAGVVLDLGVGARDGGLDALLDVVADRASRLKRRGSRRPCEARRAEGARRPLYFGKSWSQSTGAKR